jgi:hypothetical protein
MPTMFKLSTLIRPNCVSWTRHLRLVLVSAFSHTNFAFVSIIEEALAFLEEHEKLVAKGVLS